VNPPPIGRGLVAVLVASLVVTGCIDQGRPDCDDESVTLELTIAERTLAPANPSVCRDQEVTLRVTIDEAAVLHVHGYDALATEIAPEEVTEVSFRAERSGQFPIEIHPGDDARGVEIGNLTVHEP
jgi:hypothetical protein